jgi:hypothetical protein
MVDVIRRQAIALIEVWPAGDGESNRRSRIPEHSLKLNSARTDEGGVCAPSRMTSLLYVLGVATWYE